MLERSLWETSGHWEYYRDIMYTLEVDEIQNVAGIIDEVYAKFEFDYMVELSTRSDNSIGSDEEWEMATDALKNAMDSIGVHTGLKKSAIRFAKHSLAKCLI